MRFADFALLLTARGLPHLLPAHPASPSAAPRAGFAPSRSDPFRTASRSTAFRAGEPTYRFERTLKLSA